MNVPTIYCINLKQSINRRKRMENRLKNHGLHDKAVFIEAIPRDSPIIDYYHQFAKPDFHNPDEKSWRTIMACFASHLKAIRTFLESSEDECIICEDDIMFKNDFVEAYSKIRDNMLPDTPFISLSNMVHEWNGFTWAGVDPTKYNICNSNPEQLWGCQMYWISKDYAIKVLTEFDKPYVNDKYDHCAEVIIKLPGGFISYPVLAIEESEDSEIHPDHLGYHKHIFDQWGRSNYTDGEKLFGKH